MDDQLVFPTAYARPKQRGKLVVAVVPEGLEDPPRPLAKQSRVLGVELLSDVVAGLRSCVDDASSGELALHELATAHQRKAVLYQIPAYQHLGLLRRRLRMQTLLSTDFGTVHQDVVEVNEALTVERSASCGCKYE